MIISGMLFDDVSGLALVEYCQVNPYEGTSEFLVAQRTPGGNSDPCPRPWRPGKGSSIWNGKIRGRRDNAMVYQEIGALLLKVMVAVMSLRFALFYLYGSA